MATLVSFYNKISACCLVVSLSGLCGPKKSSSLSNLPLYKSTVLFDNCPARVSNHSCSNSAIVISSCTLCLISGNRSFHKSDLKFSASSLYLNAFDLHLSFPVLNSIPSDHRTTQGELLLRLSFVNLTIMARSFQKRAGWIINDAVW